MPWPEPWTHRPGILWNVNLKSRKSPTIPKNYGSWARARHMGTGHSPVRFGNLWNFQSSSKSLGSFGSLAHGPDVSFEVSSLLSKGFTACGSQAFGQTCGRRTYSPMRFAILDSLEYRVELFEVGHGTLNPEFSNWLLGSGSWPRLLNFKRFFRRRALLTTHFHNHEWTSRCYLCCFSFTLQNRFLEPFES